MSDFYWDKTKIIVFFILVFCVCLPSQAKSFKFKMGKPESSVTAARSTVSGTKMVKVIASARSADKAIDKATLDATIAAVFYGIDGNENYIDNIPPIMVNGESQYESSKNFFDKFFKKGEFLNYIHKVNSTYPTGTNNVASPTGRKITIYLIIDYKDLEQYLKSQGFKTLSSLIE